MLCDFCGIANEQTLVNGEWLTAKHVSCQLPVEISIPDSERPTGYMYIETAWQMVVHPQ